MVLKWHAADYKSLSNEDEVRAANAAVNDRRQALDSLTGMQDPPDDPAAMPATMERWPSG